MRVQNTMILRAKFRICMLMTSSNSSRPTVITAGESCAKVAARLRAGRRTGVRLDWIVEMREVAERM